MRDNKSEEIQLVAATLIKQKGYEGCSLQKIADKVGLDKSTIFHYFKNKEELLLRILEKPINEVSLNLEKIMNKNELRPEEKLREAIDNHLTLLTKHIDVANIYLNELRSLSKKNQRIYLSKRKKYEKDFEKIVGEMKKKGYLRGLDKKIVTFGILGMLNWVAKWYESEGFSRVKDISNIFYRIITEG
jgi:AcrR family transcriptional regulator